MAQQVSHYALFLKALEAGNIPAACRHAKRVPQVSLLDALRLTMLVGRRRSPDFEAFARRWLARFLSEHQPSLQLISWLADDLRHIGDPRCSPFIRYESEERLRRVERILDASGRAPEEDEYVGYDGWRAGDPKTQKSPRAWPRA